MPRLSLVVCIVRSGTYHVCKKNFLKNRPDWEKIPLCGHSGFDYPKYWFEVVDRDSLDSLPDGKQLCGTCKIMLVRKESGQLNRKERIRRGITEPSGMFRPDYDSAESNEAYISQQNTDGL